MQRPDRNHYSRLAAGLLVLAIAGAACVDKVLLPPRSTGHSVVGLRIGASIAAQAAPGALSVDVRAGYDRASGARILLAERTIPVTGSELEVSLSVDVAPCLADRDRVGAQDSCQLQIEILLRNAALATVDAAHVGPLVVSPSGSGMNPVSVNLSAHTAPALVFTVQPANTGAGAPIAPAVRVSVHDAEGNVVTGSSATIALAFGANPGGATLSGATTAQALNGVATFPSLFVTRAGVGYTLVATSAGLSAATSTAFDIIGTGPATTLSLTSGNSQSANTDALLPQPIVARVTDASGNGVAGTAVTFVVTVGGGSVTDPSVVSDASGFAATTWRLGSTVGTQTVTASAPGLSGSPVTFGATGIDPPTPQLGIATQPAGASSGTDFTTQPVVQVRDASGTLITSSTAPVTASIASGTGTLSGTTTVAAVGGIATFTNLRIAGGSAHTLRFASAGFTSATSSSFNVAQVANQLAISLLPANANNDAVFLTQPQVEVRDASGALVKNSSASVTAAIVSGSGTLAGTTTVAAAGGVATFTDLRIVGTGSHVLSFTSTGLTSTVTGNLVVGPTPDPIVVTLAPTGITTSGFNANATINPLGVGSVNYGFTLTVNGAPSCFSSGSGNILVERATSPVTVSVPQTNWQAGDQVAYRVSATRPGGVAQQGNCVVFNLLPPVLQLTPDNLTFQAAQSGSNPASQQLTMSVAPNGLLSSMGSSISYGAGASGWLNVIVPASAGAPTAITVQPTSTAIVAGTYTATVTVSGFFGTNGYFVSRQFVVTYQIQ